MYEMCLKGNETIFSMYAMVALTYWR